MLVKRRDSSPQEDRSGGEARSMRFVYFNKKLTLNRKGFNFLTSFAALFLGLVSILQATDLENWKMMSGIIQFIPDQDLQYTSWILKNWPATLEESAEQLKQSTLVLLQSV
ncbi:uncharacterized protein LOC132051630 [Lycium ferocissimum]|uniref:uncharacterized protein LOC132051630 n=1 Tax=Lycium ferocissimum TaxID=112874 RepID=UPI00281697BF|nr:uncharacterized protein LOC132051630 [Lycium ferocissimum]